jgi:hypothetical protein
MRKVLWGFALTLAVAALPAVSFAADATCAPQQETFLASLAQPAQQPAPPALAEIPPPAKPAGSCINLHCTQDSNCWPHCGGPNASYCSSTHWCTPY